MRPIKSIGMPGGQQFEVIRDFVNAKGTRYTRSKHAVGAKFHDRWVHIQKMGDGLWHVAWHHVESGETVQFIMGDVTKAPIPPVIAWHVAKVSYDEIMLGIKSGKAEFVKVDDTPTVH